MNDFGCIDLYLSRTQLEYCERDSSKQCELLEFASIVVVFHYFQRSVR